MKEEKKVNIEVTQDMQDIFFEIENLQKMKTFINITPLAQVVNGEAFISNVLIEENPIGFIKPKENKKRLLITEEKEKRTKIGFNNSKEQIDNIKPIYLDRFAIGFGKDKEVIENTISPETAKAFGLKDVKTEKQPKHALGFGRRNEEPKKIKKAKNLTEKELRKMYDLPIDEERKVVGFGNLGKKRFSPALSLANLEDMILEQKEMLQMKLIEMHIEKQKEQQRLLETKKGINHKTKLFPHQKPAAER